MLKTGGVDDGTECGERTGPALSVAGRLSVYFNYSLVFHDFRSIKPITFSKGPALNCHWFF